MRYWVASVLLGVGGMAYAMPPQTLGSLQQAAVEAVMEAAPANVRLVAEAGNLDSRLTLPACTEALVAEVPALERNVARLSVLVSCSSGQTWGVRVPVKVQMFRQVWVSQRPLTRGAMIGAEDVRLEERDVASLGYGYITEMAEFQDRKLRRALSAGTVISPGMLTARELVQRGQTVRLVASHAFIQVRAEGVALDAGDQGAVVRVRSRSCDCVVQGKVQSQGVVEAL